MDTLTPSAITDPQPYIKVSTMERFAKSIPGVTHYVPRKTWPEHGGRMVRRDYLRPGDRAVSSHYGARTVKSVNLLGTHGQSTQIVWEAPEGSQMIFSEQYDSELMIEFLPA